MEYNVAPVGYTTIKHRARGGRSEHAMFWSKIFISHSTKTAEAQAFLDAARQALEPDFEVLLDQKGLAGNDDWRAKLYQWMDEAHGAVLLLSEAAIKSDFVALEATILTWRRFRQPSFVLLIVTLGDVDKSAVYQGRFKEMALGQFQAINLTQPSWPQKLAGCFDSLKCQTQPRTPLEILRSRITKLLRKEASLDDLREVGVARLGWTADQFTAKTDYYEQFARDLLQMTGASAAQAFAAVIQMAEVGLRGANELLELITPHWVEQGRAGPVAQLALAATANRALSLNTSDPFTAHSYIGRSCCKPLTHGLPFCELQEPIRENTFADLRDQILAEFKSTSPFARQESPEFIKKRIEQREAESPPKPVYVLFPPGWVPDAEVFDALRDEFKTVTFFVLAGAAPAEKLEALKGKVHLLEPLDLAREEDAKILYTNAFEDLSKRQSAGG